MKRFHILFQIFATVALADGIYLRNCYNRMIYGPIIAGTRLDVAGSRFGPLREPYDCVIPSENEIQVVSNLNAIIIPEIELTNATIAEVVVEVNKPG